MDNKDTEWDWKKVSVVMTVNALTEEQEHMLLNAFPGQIEITDAPHNQ